MKNSYSERQINEIMGELKQGHYSFDSEFELKQEKSLASSHPDGELAYFKQKIFDLKKDISNSFKVLATKDVPLKIKTIKVISKPPKQGELKPSDVSTIQVTLTDDYKNTHVINIDIPNIREDGTFYVNGKKKCLINQLVLLPISFPKPYDSKFESSYSTFHIWSKRSCLNSNIWTRILQSWCQVLSLIISHQLD